MKELIRRQIIEWDIKRSRILLSEKEYNQVEKNNLSVMKQKRTIKILYYTYIFIIL